VQRRFMKKGNFEGGVKTQGPFVGAFVPKHADFLGRWNFSGQFERASCKGVGTMI
jgi:hypothetical protein